MAELVAAVLAGVPARIINGVRTELRQRGPDSLVVRGHGARSYADRLARYPDEVIAELVSLAGDAVFGQTGRPQGFCRNPQRECVKQEWKSANCGARAGLACGREKPARFIVFFQEADELHTERLMAAFRNTAHFVRVPRAHYDQVVQTVEFISERLEGLDRLMAPASANISGTAPSLLLPIRNFGRRELNRLVRRAVQVGIGKSDLRSFKIQFFKENVYFQGRARLRFSPTHAEIAHGTPEGKEDTIDALASHYRAGCIFPDFHWDVKPDGDSWDGTRIECRDRGSFRPEGKYVNLLVDDRIR